MPIYKYFCLIPEYSEGWTSGAVSTEKKKKNVAQGEGKGNVLYCAPLASSCRTWGPTTSGRSCPLAGGASVADGGHWHIPLPFHPLRRYPFPAPPPTTLGGGVGRTYPCDAGVEEIGRRNRQRRRTPPPPRSGPFRSEPKTPFKPFPHTPTGTSTGLLNPDTDQGVPGEDNVGPSGWGPRIHNDRTSVTGEPWSWSATSRLPRP